MRALDRPSSIVLVLVLVLDSGLFDVPKIEDDDEDENENDQGQSSVAPDLGPRSLTPPSLTDYPLSVTMRLRCLEQRRRSLWRSCRPTFTCTRSSAATPWAR